MASAEPFPSLNFQYIVYPTRSQIAVVKGAKDDVRSSSPKAPASLI